MEIKIPSEISSDFESFNFLIETFHQIEENLLKDFVFNFINVKRFDSNMCAILGVILDIAEFKENDVIFINLDNIIEKQFRDINFATRYKTITQPDKNDSLINFRKSITIPRDDTIPILFRRMIAKSNLPKLQILEGRCIFEIYNNAVLHGECKHLFSCGSYSSTEKLPILKFSLAYYGKTIKENVNEYLRTNKTGKESIEWAIKMNNTTNEKGYGFGFDAIFEFIKLKKGRLQIISSDGFLEYFNNKIQSSSFRYKYPGTIVNIEFNIDDKNYYDIEKAFFNNIQKWEKYSNIKKWRKYSKK